MDISFGAGRLFLAGYTQNHSKPSEVSYLKQYAKDFGCDVVVLRRDDFENGVGRYSTILIHSDDVSLKNTISQKAFDFTKIKSNFKSKK